MGKRRFDKYNKFDVVYADFGKNPHGVESGVRPGIIISCDASNHDRAPQGREWNLNFHFRRN